MAEEEFKLPARWYDDVKVRLKELGISQSTTARALGVSQKHISMVLNGGSLPSLSFLNNLLYYVGLKLSTKPLENVEARAEGGHWFAADRCQRCGVNYYDNNHAPCPGAVK